MPSARSADNAALFYEAGQEFSAMAALTDSGDHTTFASAADLWSGESGFDAVVRPNGLVTGGAITPKSGTNNAVSVAALTCYLAGVLTSVAAGDVTATRGTTNGYRITSITVDSSGALAAVAGTESTAFSATRGAAGGPPLIPVGSIEIGQVRLTSTTAAVVAEAEIRSVIGDTVERYDYPLFDINYREGSVEFVSALPLIHTGSVPKKVYAEYYEPVFAEISNAFDYVPPEESYSTTSTAVYGGAVSATSASLGQGSFSAMLQDGITDPIVSKKGKVLWFKFFPDRLRAPYQLAQGKLGISRTFPASGNIQGAFTINASEAAKEVAE